jgi:hypothetical protein
MADHSKDADGRGRPEREGAIADEGAPRPGSRDRYRDNDDVRDPIPDDQRLGTSPDTRTEARGDARENVGNTSRDTAAERTGPDAHDPRDRPEGRPRYAQGSE